MSRLALTFAIVSLCAASIAEAQPRGSMGGGGKPPAGMGGGPAMGRPMGQGGGGVSPVMMACRDDMAKTCPGLMGMPGVQCLMDNITDLSDPCADALGTAMDNMQQNHGDGTDGDGDEN